MRLIKGAIRWLVDWAFEPTEEERSEILDQAVGRLIVDAGYVREIFADQRRAMAEAEAEQATKH